MLRILAGTLGVDIEPSKWLLFTGMVVALFLGFAKRRTELIRLNDQGGEHRRVLIEYTDVVLDNAIVISATSVIIAYGLYTLSPSTIETHGTDQLIFTVPIVMYGVFRYLFTLHRAGGGGDGQFFARFQVVGIDVVVGVGLVHFVAFVHPHQPVTVHGETGARPWLGRDALPFAGGAVVDDDVGQV